MSMDTLDAKGLFGRNIGLLINQKNWTIKKAAEELDYPRNDLSAIMSGKKNFRLGTAVKIAKYFDISVYLLFDRLFETAEYRKKFPFVDTNYNDVIRENFSRSSSRQSAVDLDATTVSHLMNGRRNNPTINTFCKIAGGANLTVSALLKTDADQKTEEILRRDSE